MHRRARVRQMGEKNERNVLSKIAGMGRLRGTVQADNEMGEIGQMSHSDEL